jgi:hypothetical protein
LRGSKFNQYSQHGTARILYFDWFAGFNRRRCCW